MNFHTLERIFHFFAGVGPVMGMVWIGLCIFTIGMLILMYTRWGQSHPLEKCMALSVLAHILLAGYATTVSLSMPTLPTHDRVFQIAVMEGDSDGNSSIDSTASNGDSSEKADTPWDAPHHEVAAPPKPVELDRTRPELPRPERVVRSEIDKLRGDPALEKTALPKVASPEPKLAALDKPPLLDASSESAAAIEAPKPQCREASELSIPSTPFLNSSIIKESSPEIVRKAETDIPHALLQPVVSLPRMNSPEMPIPGKWLDTESDPNETGIRVRAAENAPNQIGSGDDAAGGNSSAIRRDGASIRGEVPRIASLSSAPNPNAGQSLINRKEFSPNGAGEGGSAEAIPEIYKLRVMPNRSDVTRTHGGSPETEKAVQAALEWLSENQFADGRWKAGDHGAGRDENVQGHARQNAGSQADTGITGLALLAFLAGGHTHEEGQYKDNVRRGLEYLLRVQARDGNLGGEASTYEFMYCHAMAACALSEAYGMTHDKQLREPLVRAINYTVAAQDRRGGGWRYKPGDPGDTSQLGWQLMSLKSAELAGIPIPDSTRRGIIKFLQSVSSGKNGGLASYRSGEQVLRSMTAEALVCWQFLGLSRNHSACNEAGDFLLGELPGLGVNPNDYYWYYGTLAMYQLQGIYWQRWNEALQRTLLERQVKDGPLAGTWNTDTVWGGYGGRIYTTAIATLSLEVYYRFLPLYAETATAEEKAK